MDLLNENKNKKKKKTKGEKIVLFLLIISVVLAIIVTALLFIIRNSSKLLNDTYMINGSNAKDNLEIIKLEDKSTYISIRSLCQQLDYMYYNGEYNVNGEDKNKGYVINNKSIIQFFADSKYIFKTTEEEEKDYEQYQLKNNIMLNNEVLYINVEDLSVALNLIYRYSSEKKQITLLSPEYWITVNTESFEEAGYIISDSIENIKAIPYGYVIVENNNKKLGVLNLSKQEIIGTKYNSISFIEFTGEFIVSNNNDKFGIININGLTQVDLQYDSIEVLNYSPLLYQVERQEKYGIMRADGTIINEIKYSSVGYPKDISNNIYYTLIIPELNENIEKSIVVCIDNKYGLINLETGKEILPCEFKGIFMIVDQDSKAYYVIQFEDGTVNTIENYINSLNQITVNMNNS